MAVVLTKTFKENIYRELFCWKNEFAFLQLTLKQEFVKLHKNA